VSNEKPSDIRPYGRFVGDELILRDELALDRTLMASERTMLSYLRTSLGLLVVGGTVVKLNLMGSPIADTVVGVISFALALFLTYIGITRHLTLLRSMRPLRANSERAKQDA